MSSGPDTPTDRPGLPPVPRRLATHVSRVGQASVPTGTGATSSWLGARARGGRVLRRLAMPLAWMVTLVVCAGSAFAVRDVVFPPLGESASRSLWEPRPVPSVGTAPSIRSTTSAERPLAPTVDAPAAAAGTEATAVEPTVETSGSDDPFSDQGALAWPAQQRSDDDASAPADSAPQTPTVTTSPDDDETTVTTVAGGHSSGGGSSGGTSTSVVTTTSAPEDTTTTDGGTDDTIEDQSGRTGSGPGGGGGSDDDLP